MSRTRSKFRRLLAFLVSGLVVMTLASCSSDADVVNKNISNNADNFQIPRRITCINGITDKYLLTITGYCSIDTSNPVDLTVTCNTGEGYIRQYLGRSDNVTWIVEQLDPAKVSPKFYQINFKPESILPDFQVR